jgi:hypothetical protein
VTAIAPRGHMRACLACSCKGGIGRRRWGRAASLFDVDL